MSLVLTTLTNPGQASWSDVAALGGIQTIKQRVQLSDIQVAQQGVVALFSTPVPAGGMIVGVSLYVTDLPAGGGVTSVNTIIGSVIGVNQAAFAFPDLVDASSGIQPQTGFQPPPVFAVQQVILPPPTHVPPLFSQTLVAFNPIWGVNADVNLDTLTAFDATFLVFYAVPNGLSVP